MNSIELNIPFPELPEGGYEGRALEGDGFREQVVNNKSLSTVNHSHTNTMLNTTQLMSVTDLNRHYHRVFKSEYIKDYRQAIEADFVRIFSRRDLVRKYDWDFKDTRYEWSSMNIVRYPIKGRNDLRKGADSRMERTKFKFDQDNLKIVEEVNVDVGSAFKYNRPQQFEFNYLRGANNNSPKIDRSTLPLYSMTKKDYIILNSKFPQDYPDIPPSELVVDPRSNQAVSYTDVAPEQEFMYSKDPRRLNPWESYATTRVPTRSQFPKNHKDYWAEPAFKNHWVEFPTEDQLTQYLGEAQTELIVTSPEYTRHKDFLERLNGGEFECIMNPVIPHSESGAEPMRIGTPLNRLPKSLEYNMAHHGILKIDLARGQRQQYDVQPLHGRKFVIGDTHTYYTHNHNVVNFREYGESHDVYKKYVRSSANYHFACKAPLEGSPTHMGTGPSQANYRYEGNLNIERVTVQEKNAGNEKNLVDYIQGIHLLGSESLFIRSPVLHLLARRPVPHQQRLRTLDGRSSFLRMDEESASIGLHIPGDDEQAEFPGSSERAGFSVSRNSGRNGGLLARVVADHINLAGRITVRKEALFGGPVSIHDGHPLTCTEIRDLERINHRNLVISGNQLIIQ